MESYFSDVLKLISFGVSNYWSWNTWLLQSLKMKHIFPSVIIVFLFVLVSLSCKNPQYGCLQKRCISLAGNPLYKNAAVLNNISFWGNSLFFEEIVLKDCFFILLPQCYMLVMVMIMTEVGWWFCSGVFRSVKPKQSLQADRGVSMVSPSSTPRMWTQGKRSLTRAVQWWVEHKCKL